MNELANTIGHRIRIYRKKANLSQEKLSEIANCHPTYIGQLERGEKNATLESIEKIANALDIPLSQLFDKIGTENDANYANLCYQFLLEKTEDEQEFFYKLMNDLEAYKNK